MLQVVAAGTPLGVTRNARAAAPSPVLSIGFLQTIDSLNPYRGINDPSYLLYGLIYDYPYAFDQDGKLVPNIVTSSSCANPLCTAWNYTVRQNVYWSDGTLLTPRDVNFTFNYDSQNLAKLWAFEPYFNQVVQCTNTVTTKCGAVISGPTRQNVTVYFQHSFAPGPDLFAPIVQWAQWNKIQPSTAETSYANKNPIGTGPFKADPNIYSQFLSQSGTNPIHLYKNTRYHPLGGTQTPTVNITDLYLYVYGDPTSLVTALNGGVIQLAMMPPSSLGAVDTTKPIMTQTALTAIQEWNQIGITQVNNTKLNPIRYDTSVRVALAHATNKDYIIQQYYDGLGQRGDTLISPIVPWWYNPVTGGDNLTFNVPLANQILNQTGYDTWSGGSFGNGVREATSAKTVSYQPPCYQCVSPPNATATIPKGEQLAFTLAVRPPSEFPEELATAQYLHDQWAKIGVAITIKQETTESALSTDVYNGNVEMYIWYWSSDQDPNYMLSMESSWTLDGWNDNYWNNGTYNQLYLKQLGDLDYSQRLADVQAAQKIQYDSATYIIYIYPYGVWSMRYDIWSGWGNWKDHPYRQMNAYWGANPLFFDLNCPNCTTVVTNAEPSPPTIVPGGTISTYVNETTFFNASSIDPETYDQLNFTWSWGDGSSSYNNHTASTATVMQSHLWNVTGQYQVSVSASDGINNPVYSLTPTTVNVIPIPTNAGTVRGTVKDPGGTPIAGASVIAIPSNLAKTTAADGTYSLLLAAGTYNLTANKTLYSADTVHGVVVTASGTSWANFTLTPNIGWITGTVKDSQTGNAITGALVKLTLAGNVVNQSTTPAGGTFNFTQEPGTYTINVTATGYYGKDASAQVLSGQEVVVPITLTKVPVVAPGLDPLVIGGIAAVVIIAVGALLAVLLLRRRKTKETEEGKIELPPKT